jgi:DNA repair exonuclease SbcCD ATPase subunit
VEHVPRPVFRQVFAVTLADLAGLDDETWARIQDRIVGSMGSSDLRPARVVADDLEREASEIWRPNRRGNQRLRDLQEELRALRGRRQLALERDREIRTLVEERENVRVRLREVREEREAHRIALERAQTLRPLRSQLARIDGLRAKGGPRDELRGVPAESRAVLADASDELVRHRRRLASLDAQIAEADAAIATLDDDARQILDSAERIGAFVAETAEAAGDRRRVREADASLAELAAQIEAAAMHLFDGGWRRNLQQRIACGDSGCEFCFGARHARFRFDLQLAETRIRQRSLRPGLALCERDQTTG